MLYVVDHIEPAAQAPPRLLQELRETLQRLDVNTLTPIEALLKLNELKLALQAKG